jgi:hypothetical protein
MPDSPFISDTDRNTIAVASDTYCALLELGRCVEEAIAEAKEARDLLQAAAWSERPAKREEAYKACKITQGHVKAVLDLAQEIDIDAGTLRAMARKLAHDHS